MQILGVTWIYRPYNVFLQFWYLWGVYIKNPIDAILAPLSILQNMQIRSAIMQNSFFKHNLVNPWTNMVISATKPMFSGSTSKIKHFSKCLAG